MIKIENKKQLIDLIEKKIIKIGINEVIYTVSKIEFTKNNINIFFNHHLLIHGKEESVFKKLLAYEVVKE